MKGSRSSGCFWLVDGLTNEIAVGLLVPRLDYSHKHPPQTRTMLAKNSEGTRGILRNMIFFAAQTVKVGFFRASDLIVFMVNPIPKILFSLWRGILAWRGTHSALIIDATQDRACQAGFRYLKNVCIKKKATHPREQPTAELVKQPQWRLKTGGGWVVWLLGSIQSRFSKPQTQPTEASGHN